jgi:hypothetical protein
LTAIFVFTNILSALQLVGEPVERRAVAGPQHYDFVRELWPNRLEALRDVVESDLGRRGEHR